MVYDQSGFHLRQEPRPSEETSSNNNAYSRRHEWGGTTRTKIVFHSGILRKDYVPMKRHPSAVRRFHNEIERCAHLCQIYFVCPFRRPSTPSRSACRDPVCRCCRYFWRAIRFTPYITTAIARAVLETNQIDRIR